MDLRITANNTLDFVQSTTGNPAEFISNTYILPGTHIVDVSYSQVNLNTAPSIVIDGNTVPLNTFSRPSGTALSDSANSLIIGNATGSANGFPGYISELIFAKTKMTANQIAVLNADQTAYWIPTFSFLLDAYSQFVSAAFSVRRIINTWNSPIVNLRRGSDNATQDFSPLANGDFSVAVTNAFANGATLFVTTWYDQSGHNNHVSQASAALQPIFNANGVNWHPTLSFSMANSTVLTKTSPSSLPTGNSSRTLMIGIADRFRNLWFGGYGNTAGGGNSWVMYTSSTPTSAQPFIDTVGGPNNFSFVSPIGGGYHIAIASYDGSNVRTKIDNAAFNIIAANSNIINTAALNLQVGGFGGNRVDGQINEFIILNIDAIGTGIANTLYNNQQPYYKPFTYALDVLPLESFSYSLRQLRNTYIGIPLATFRRDSDNATINAYPVVGVSHMNVANIQAWAGSANVFCTNLFDQTTNGISIVQSTASRQPQLIYAAGLNNHPGLLYIEGSDKVLANLTESVQTTDVFSNTGVVSLAYFQTGLTTAFRRFWSFGGTTFGNTRLMMPTGLTQWEFAQESANTTNVNFTGIWLANSNCGLGSHVVDIVYSSANIANAFPMITVDNVNPGLTQIGALGNTFYRSNAGIQLGNQNSIAAPPALLCELIGWKSVLSNTQLSALRQNQMAYWIPAGPTLNLSFVAPLDANVTFTRASGNATYINASGFMLTANVNEARFETNGLLVEETRTNVIRNSRLQGGANGVTLPTNITFFSSANLSYSIANSGAISNGINYIDIRLFSNNSNAGFTNINLENGNSPATNGQPWAVSSYLANIAGSSANVITLNLQQNVFNVGNVYLSTPFNMQLLPVISSSFVKLGGTQTINVANVAWINPNIQLTCNANVAIDITLRIGLPQLEQGNCITSSILTSGTAVTRAADSVFITSIASLANLTEGSLYFEADNNSNNNNYVIGGLADTNFSNAAYFSVLANNLSWTRSSQVSVTLPMTSNTLKMVGTYSMQNGSFNMALNGTLGPGATITSLPTVNNRIGVGHSPWLPLNQMNGHIKRVKYWPRKLDNVEMVVVTT